MISGKKSRFPVPADDASLKERSTKLAERGLDDIGQIRKDATLAESAREDIHAAALYHDVDTVREVLETSPEKASEQDEFGLAPIHYAAFGGSAAAVETLLKAGADVDQKDNSGNTALFYGSKLGGGWTSIVMMNAGADPNHKNSDGESPLDRSMYRGLVAVPPKMWSVTPEGFREPQLALTSPPNQIRWPGRYPDIVVGLIRGGAAVRDLDIEIINVCISELGYALSRDGSRLLLVRRR